MSGRTDLSVNLGINQFPQTVEEFTGLRDKFASTPQGGVALFIIALNVYTQNPVLGTTFLTIAVDQSKTSQSPGDPSAVKGLCLNRMEQSNFKSRMKQDYAPRSYLAGATPQNGYTFSTPITINIYQQSIDQITPQMTLKLFTYCGGSDFPRPMQVKKNSKGVWKAYEYSSFQIGVKPIAVDDGDDL